jgi:hypothetical protein
MLIGSKAFVATPVVLIFGRWRWRALFATRSGRMGCCRTGSTATRRIFHYAKSIWRASSTLCSLGSKSIVSTSFLRSTCGRCVIRTHPSTSLSTPTRSSTSRTLSARSPNVTMCCARELASLHGAGHRWSAHTVTRWIGAVLPFGWRRRSVGGDTGAYGIRGGFLDLPAQGGVHLSANHLS